MKKNLILVVLGVLMGCEDGPPYYWHACIEENNQLIGNLIFRAGALLT
jgi:hypothetical protein